MGAAVLLGWCFAVLTWLPLLIDDDATIRRLLINLEVGPLFFGSFQVWIARRLNPDT